MKADSTDPWGLSVSRTRASQVRRKRQQARTGTRIPGQPVSTRPQTMRELRSKNSWCHEVLHINLLLKQSNMTVT